MPRATPNSARSRADRASHSDSKTLHICNECDKTFRTPSSFLRHKTTHLVTKPHQCPYEPCFKSFAQKSQLATHVASQHEKTYPYQCKYTWCDTKFNDAAIRSRHYRKQHAHDIDLDTPPTTSESPIAMVPLNEHDITTPIYPSTEPTMENLLNFSNLNLHDGNFYGTPTIPLSAFGSSPTPPSSIYLPAFAPPFPPMESPSMEFIPETPVGSFPQLHFQPSMYDLFQPMHEWVRGDARLYAQTHAPVDIPFFPPYSPFDLAPFEGIMPELAAPSPSLDPALSKFHDAPMARGVDFLRPAGNTSHPSNANSNVEAWTYSPSPSPTAPLPDFPNFFYNDGQFFFTNT